MDIKVKVGLRLKQARIDRGLKLREVCARVPGLSVGRLSNYEQGTRMPGIEDIQALAAALNTSPEYLLTLVNEPVDHHETHLLKLFRASDVRGREAILYIAGRESSFAEEKVFVERRNVNAQVWHGTERRKH